MGRLFGTDGVRGIANSELTCELAMKLGRAAAMVLSNNSRRRPLFVIGMDTRISSEMLSSAITAGLCSVGADVMILGTVPTPAVAYLIGKYKADAGIMISASHNSAEYNGIKMFSGDGYKLADVLEEEIESIVIDNAKDFKPVEGANVGKVTYADSAVKHYVEHLKSTIPNSLDGIKIAIDCANGSASVTAERLMAEVGADATILYDKPDGININEDCGSTHLEKLSKFVVENKMDIGIAFDGDADRCLCVDENGEVIDGDQIMAICALDMKERGKLAKQTAIGTILTNLGFVKFCEANDINFIATKVGDRYVLEEMLLEEYNFGGEQSGHVIFRDYATTGDGELTAIQLLSLVKRSGKKVSELVKIMNKYPQVSINVKVSQEGKVQFYTNSKVKKAIDDAKEKLSDTGRIVVRPSGTEPKIRVMVECFDEELLHTVANDVAKVIEEELGTL